ncbi:MAG: hypothetical protein IJU23_09170 [Proteobacteria bacterium]|nr:hypothetical protein [Pseudomonadota bacterium]
MSETTEYTPPRTERERLMQTRERLCRVLDGYMTAYEDLVAGRITSYSLGTRSITRYAPDLKTLADEINKLQNQIYEIEAVLNGRARRNTSRYVFIDPSMIGRRW